MIGKIRFSAQGEQLSAFREELRQAHLHCKFQQIRGGIFYASAQAYDWYGIAKIAQKHDIQLDTLECRGLYFRLKPYRLRIGIVVGLLGGALICYRCNAFVRTIEICGNTNITEETVFRALSNLGVGYGTAFRSMDFTYIERMLCAEIRDIQWVALRHTGGRLVIDLREEVKPPQMLHERIPCNYVSNVSAQITSIRVLSGYAAVRTGDHVKAGDVLISGVEEDINGVTRYTHATGEVVGIYPYDIEFFQPFCEEITVHGEPLIQPFLSVFGKRIPLRIGFTPPDEPFSYTEQVQPLMLFGRRTPFAQIEGIYTPLVSTIAAYSPAEADALLEEKMLRWEQNLHRNDRIVERKIVRCETDLGILLKINYIFEGVVGKESEIFVKLS